MDAAEQMVLKWVAGQPVLIQIGLSLALIFLIGPALLVACAAAVTKLESGLEGLLARNAGSSPGDNSLLAESQTESNAAKSREDRAAADALIPHVVPHEPEGV